MERDAIIIIVGFLIGYYLDYFWARVQRGMHLEKKEYYKFIFGEMRVHHNWIGYVMILFGFFWYPLILVPAGIGSIVGHRIRDNLFWFIERVEKDIKRTKKDVKAVVKQTKKNIRKVKKRVSRK